jgi:uncharacterized protein
VDPDQPGTAAVVDGVLVVTPPRGAGRPAAIACDPGIELTTDGTGAVVRDEFPSLSVRAEVAPDELSATIAVERLPGARYRLADQSPGTSITLHRMVADRIPCPEPTREELLEALAAQGVVEGVDEDALERILRGEFGPLLVARGRAATPAVDGRVQLGRLSEGTDRFVREGAQLARLTPSEPGTPGMTVTGRVLDPGDPRPANLVLGDGVRVEDDGRVVAAIDGHVHFADRLVTVTPALRITSVRGRDEDVSSPGSVDVAGSVEDGARLRARRSVFVSDQVRGATVEAGFSLEIDGAAFDSQLRAGHTGAVLARIAAQLAPLAGEVGKVHAGVVQLLGATRDSSRELHPIRALAITLERIAPELESDIKRVLAEADRERGTVPHDVMSAVRGAYEDLDAMRTGRLPIEALSGVAETFDREASRLRLLTAAGAELRVELLQKCEVEVIGALRVTGKGIVDSVVRIHGPLEVTRPDALIRGGRVLLDGDGVVTELAPGAGGLEIELAPGATLTAGIVQPGVIIHVPDATRRVSRVVTDVVIAADEPAA